jgi:hypothetical protein
VTVGEQVDLGVDIVDRIDDPVGAFEEGLALVLAPQADVDVNSERSAILRWAYA